MAWTISSKLVSPSQPSRGVVGWLASVSWQHVRACQCRSARSLHRSGRRCVSHVNVLLYENSEKHRPLTHRPAGTVQFLGPSHRKCDSTRPDPTHFLQIALHTGEPLLGPH